MGTYRSPFFLLARAGRLRWCASGGLHDPIGLDALGADAEAFDLPVDEGAYGLQVRIPPPEALIVSVADVVAELWAFATNVASSSHVLL